MQPTTNQTPLSIAPGTNRTLPFAEFHKQLNARLRETTRRTLQQGFFAVFHTRQFGWAVEPTREAMAQLLATATETALEYGLRVSVDVALTPTGDRILAKATIALWQGGTELVRYSAHGEGVLTAGGVTNPETGAVEPAVSETAARAAETRALKRALELFAPDLMAMYKAVSSFAAQHAQGETYAAKAQAARSAIMQRGAQSPQNGQPTAPQPPNPQARK